MIVGATQNADGTTRVRNKNVTDEEIINHVKLFMKYKSYTDSFVSEMNELNQVNRSAENYKRNFECHEDCIKHFT